MRARSPAGIETPSCSTDVTHASLPTFSIVLHVAKWPATRAADAKPMYLFTNMIFFLVAPQKKMSFFVSLEPIRGDRLDVYPEESQAKIKALRVGQGVYLGKECFGATVRRLDVRQYVQNTPGIDTKPAGTRDVALVSLDDEVFLKKTRSGWRLVTHGAGVEKKVRNLVQYPSAHYTWQWSRCVDLGASRNIDWVNYNPTHNGIIENAFDHGTHVNVTVGLKNYNIDFISQNGNLIPYGVQTDVERNKRRWIRRARCQCELFECPDNELTCALCCEEFSSTRVWPWSRTICGHVFHTACLACLPVTDPCPMCRAPLTQ